MVSLAPLDESAATGRCFLPFQGPLKLNCAGKTRLGFSGLTSAELSGSDKRGLIAATAESLLVERIFLLDIREGRLPPFSDIVYRGNLAVDQHLEEGARAAQMWQQGDVGRDF